jgi:2-desacetyl-2-hydroxyethyl bacteriochlorophyllide A dehydrogenase
MKAVTLVEPGLLVLGDAPDPGPPGEGEALVTVRRIGVCGTDLHAFGGRQPFFTYPRVLGHELGVEVSAVGPGVTSVSVGARCAVEPYLDCGACIACRRGKPNCCQSLRVLGVHTDGGMRGRFLVPARKLHPSSLLALDQLALVETLGIGCHAVERARIEEGEFALVTGAGPIGMATAQFAAEAGARVIVLDVNQARLDFCAAQLGVRHVVNSSAASPLDEVRRIAGGDLPTVVFDATGNPGSMASSFDHVAPGGRLVFVGLFQGDVSFSDPAFHRKELTLLGSRNALPGDFGRIIRLVESGRIDTTPWITHRATLEAVPREFPSWTRPETGVVKAMIEA